MGEIMSSDIEISAVAGKKGLESVFSDIYGAAKGQLKLRFKRWKAKKNIGLLYTKIKNICKVNTILQPEKSVDLIKFYYPSKIKIEGKRRIISDISELNWDGNIVINGTVGQGKSIFFRYLTSREMIKGKAIPLFVELRKIKKGTSLLEHLIEEAKTLGLKDIDSNTFLWLAEKGKVILLLDAFDEVPQEQRMDLTTDIEQLSKRYEMMRILISSRPKSGIENSPLFRVFELEPLVEKEYEEAINVMAEASVADNIINAIRGSKTPVRELLSTPLMVALLIVRHRIEQTIPENLIGFYKGLFWILIGRHDKLKGGYTRPRKSGLGDTALEDVFNGICFMSRKKMEGTYERREIVQYAKKSASLSGHKGNAEYMVDDIIEITCMILEEGGECKFIHKSVQEYHAACFIKNQPDEVALRFYEHGKKDPAHFDLLWSEEISFLRMIDRYRLLKWYLIPSACRMLSISESALPRSLNISSNMITSLFSGLSVRISGGNVVNWFIPLKSNAGASYSLLKSLDEDIFAGLSFLEDSISTNDVRDSSFQEYCALENLYLTKGEFKNWAKNKINKIYTKLIKEIEYVKQVEARKEIFEF